MARYIDADRARETATVDLIVHHLDRQPTVDAVEVVRCEECENYIEATGWCREHSHFTNADGEFCHPRESVAWKSFDHDYFCAEGVRRGDG